MLPSSRRPSVRSSPFVLPDSLTLLQFLLSFSLLFLLFLSLSLAISTAPLPLSLPLPLSVIQDRSLPISVLFFNRFSCHHRFPHFASSICFCLSNFLSIRRLFHPCCASREIASRLRVSRFPVSVIFHASSDEHSNETITTVSTFSRYPHLL